LYGPPGVEEIVDRPGIADRATVPRYAPRPAPRRSAASEEVGMTAGEWIAAYAAALGTAAPDDADVAAILELAAVAAHGSERTAAPVACWLAALSGRSPREALEVARAVVAHG
jgi:hypothetical protein